jgi:signal transduction histidine kinase
MLIVLPKEQAAWIAPLLVASAMGTWYGLRAGPVPQPQPAAAPAPVGRAPEEAITDPRLRELHAELNKLRHMQAETVQARQTAEAAMLSKSEFLATMSHEIRAR